MLFNTPEEVITWADRCAQHDYQKHCVIHKDPDGTLWQVDKNPYCTAWARSDWQRGFDGVPPRTWEGRWTIA